MILLRNTAKPYMSEHRAEVAVIPVLIPLTVPGLAQSGQISRVSLAAPFASQPQLITPTGPQDETPNTESLIHYT